MATSAVLTTTACSDSDLNEVVPETPQEVANAYFQMTVDVSSTSSDTRATAEDGTKITKEDLEDTPKTDPGIEFEQKLTKAYIYLFKVNEGKDDNGQAYEGNPITLNLLSTTTTEYNSTIEKVPVGTYHAYVTFNEQIPVAKQKSAALPLRTRAYSVPSTKKEADFVKEASSYISGILTTSDKDLQSNGIPMSSNAAQITQETSATGVSTDLNSPTLKDTIFATIKIDDKNTKSNPLKFTVKAVRCLAKISYMNTDVVFTLWNNTTNATNAKNDNTKTTGKLGTVKLLSYAPFNVERHYYMFRHVGDLTDGGVINTTTYGYYYNQKTVTTSNGVESEPTYSFQYVYDPDSRQKRYEAGALTCADTVYLNSIGELLNTKSSVGTSIKDATYLSLAAASSSSSTGSVLAYVPENVMTAANQKRGYVTGVIFKAQLNPTEVLTATFATDSENKATTTINGTIKDENFAVGKDLYYSEPTGKFYTDLATLLYATKLDKTYEVEDLDGVKTVSKTGGSDGETEEVANEEEVKLRNSYGIYYYAKGICYYPFYIYHKLSSASTMQPMEYAIVRNNDYQLTVNTVAIRTAEGINLKPTEDVELKETYLQATVTILPWTVRSNSMDLGNY
jgi:hypothetical protein